jgi:hypothetical protein
MEYMIKKVQRTLIYFGALHLPKLFIIGYKYYAALPLA